MNKHDICIVGGGIAGTMAALFLAKEYGIACTLIERSAFPREKICGDGVSGWVVGVLKELDSEMLEELLDSPFVLPSYGIRISAPNYKHVDLPFDMNAIPGNGTPPGFTAKRVHLDNFLFEKARQNPLIEIKENTEVTGFTKSDIGFRLQLNSGESEPEARMVLFAQGTGSLNAPGMNPGDPSDTFIGLRGYYKNVEGFHEHNYIELHFLKETLPGYLWVFPMAEGMANVGIGMRKKHILKKKISLKTELQKALETCPALKERFQNAVPSGPLQAHPIPLWTKRRSISGDRFMILGDAARLVDPVTGEGMGHAALSAKYAAATASMALKNNNFAAGLLKQYDNELYKVIKKELEISRMVSHVISRPFLLNTFMNKAERNPWLTEGLAAAMGDLETRKKLKNPWFYIKMLFS